jgi:CBS domain-containing protein
MSSAIPRAATSSYSPALHAISSTTPIASLLELRPIIRIDADASPEEGFHVLTSSRIHAAPVFDSRSNAWVGLVDLKDFASFVLHAHDHPDAPKARFVREVCNFSGTDNWISLFDDATVESALKRFARIRYHRMPVMSRKDPSNMLCMASQASLLAFIHRRMPDVEEDFKGTKASDLIADAGLSLVVSVTIHGTMLDVFRFLMKTNVNGVAIVDSKGRLINNISISDLKFTERNHQRTMEATVERFIQLHPERHVAVYCSPDAPMTEVIKKVVENKVSRVYVCGPDRVILGIITQTDIIDWIATRLLTKPA